MQMGWRKWWIRKTEFPEFKKFGLRIEGKDILEVGCGSGYSAALITNEKPNSDTGLDIMPGQLKTAEENHLLNARFIEGSADDLSMFPEKSFRRSSRLLYPASCRRVENFP